jgi:exodeoxyribonuclease V alpha subunit
MALLRRCSLMTGGAGVGKTSCLRAVVDAARHFGLHIWQLALAGRAAQRMSEATGAPAQTIASWLAAAADGKAETGTKVLVIVDEASMLDLPTTYRLLFHMHPSARLLLVGDVAQLPPIGFGLVLHRLALGTTVPRTELTLILRSTEATGIPAVSRAVRDGILPDLPAYVPGLEGCSFLEADPDDVVRAIRRVRDDLQGVEVQVVGSVYAGTAGIDAVNATFHAANAIGKPSLGRFAPGDPVIWTANDRVRGLWNGSMGTVTDIRAGKLCLVLDGRQVEIGADDLDRLDLAYAVSTHKAQGSQFDTVVVPAVRSRLLDRTLLYTALTRGVRRVVVVGCRTTLERAVLRPPWSLARDVAFMV